jgi:hypothetical protein
VLAIIWPLIIAIYHTCMVPRADHWSMIIFSSNLSSVWRAQCRRHRLGWPVLGCPARIRDGPILLTLIVRITSSNPLVAMLHITSVTVMLDEVINGAGEKVLGALPRFELRGLALFLLMLAHYLLWHATERLEPLFTEQT